MVAIALERCDGGQIDLHALVLGLLDESLVGINEFRGGLFHMTTVSEVVHTLEDDQGAQTTLVEDITLEALHGRFTQAALNHAVATDT